MQPSICSAFQPLDTFFRNRPIGSLETLARMLRLTPDELCSLSNIASTLYQIAGKKRKSDGSVRILFDAKFPLKTIQARIQCMILQTVDFPEYLQGSIRKRGQATNARAHTGRRSLITEDIQNFFPTVSSDLIFDVWHGFFQFPPKVAECLTQLTTKDSVLPQGAKTSPLLSNLVFWRDEYALVSALRRRGIFYTRLVDDITCSSNRDLSPTEVNWLIHQLHSLGRRRGLRLKRKKQTITFAGDRMITTKLVVNDKVSLPHEERSRIRAAVDVYVEGRATEHGNCGALDQAYNRISGQLSYLTQHHPNEGRALRSRLQRARSGRV